MAWRLAHDGEADSVYPLPRTRGRVGEAGTHSPLFPPATARRRPSPCPSPARGGGSAPSLREQRSRHADEIDHGGLVGMRREADGGGAGGGKRLRDLAGETKVHGRERALEHAGARGAIEIGLRAAAGKKQNTRERPPPPRPPPPPRRTPHPYPPQKPPRPKRPARPGQHT